jgi:hypothetical protein
MFLKIGARLRQQNGIRRPQEHYSILRLQKPLKCGLLLHVEEKDLDELLEVPATIARGNSSRQRGTHKPISGTSTR